MKQTDCPSRATLLRSNSIQVLGFWLFALAFFAGCATVHATSGISRETLNRLDRQYGGDAFSADYKGNAPAVAVASNEMPARQRQMHEAMRDYAYLSYLVESGQSAKAEELFAKQKDRDKWPPAMTMLEAEMQYDEKHLDAARKDAEAVIADYPDTVDAYVLLARICAEEKKYDQAIKALEKGRKIAPGNSALLEALGRCYGEQMKRVSTDGERAKILDRIEGVYEDLVKVLAGRSAAPFLNVLAYIKQEKKESKEAIAYLDRLSRIDPKRMDTRLQMARLQEGTGDQVGALDTLTRAFLFDPGDNETIKALDVSLVKNKKTPIEFYKSMSEQYPGRDAVQVQYARMLLSNGKTDEAAKVLKALLDLHPHNDNAWLLMAGALHDLGQPAESSKAVAKYLAESPKDPTALAKAVRLLLVFGATEEASRYLAQLRSLDPGYPEIGDLALQVNVSAGDYQKALDELRASVAARPEEFTKYPVLVQILNRLGHPGEAIEPLKKALAVAPADQWTALATLLMGVYQKTNRLDDALALVQQAVQKDPANSEWRLALARVYKSRHENDKAVKALDELIKASSDNPTMLHDIGVIEWEMGRHEQAESLIRRAIKIDPKTADFYNTLGYFFCESKVQLDEALTLVKKALELKPGAGYIMDSLGWIYFQQGDYANAVKALEDAATKENDDPTVLSHLAQAYLKLGRKADALKQLKSALQVSESESDAAKLRKDIETIEKQ